MGGMGNDPVNKRTLERAVSSKRRTNELGLVADDDDLGMIPDVEPSEEAENQSDERVTSELASKQKKRGQGVLTSLRESVLSLTRVFVKRRIHLNLFQGRR